MTDDNEKTKKKVTFVDIYRKHKELLSIYFKSEDEVIECERRAEMGDDRAFRLLTIANRAMYPSYYNNDGLAVMYTMSVGNPNKLQNKETGFNHRALSFVESVAMGNRSSLQNERIFVEYNSHGSKKKPMMWFPPIDDSVKDIHTTYEKQINSELESKNLPKQMMGSKHVIVLKNTADYRLDIAPILRERQPESYNNPDTSYLNLLIREDDYQYYNVKKYESQDYTGKIDALITCAQSGDSAAARLLAQFYKQQYFYEYTTKLRLFGKSEYATNKYFNSVKAKEWERVADALEGKGTTSIERDKFLKEFLHCQDKTPEGLYNIGYALFHNEHIGNKTRGIDYLKHSANLGNANAAHELGEVSQNEFDATGDKNALQLSHFWYKIAAATPMKAEDSTGKVTEYDGHPNAKARIAYLEKAYPELGTVLLDENNLRNPSEAHRRQYPASMWASEIPITDISNLLHDPSRGAIETRMKSAVEAIDEHVHEFEIMTGGIQAKIDEVIARQAILDSRIEGLKGSEVTALRHNDGLSAEQRKSERAMQLSKDRWLKETTANLGGTLIAGYLTGGASFAHLVVHPFAHGIPGSHANNAKNMLIGNKVRAGGYHAVMENEVAYQQAIINELESRKIDTSRMPDEIKALAQEIQRVADSGPMKRLMKDENKSRAIVEGYLRQRILKSGLANCRYLDDYAKQNGIESVDALLNAFSNGDARLSKALSDLCYGHPNSNDMAVILADTNALKGDLAPHEKALKQFVERILKDNISEYMTRASQIDVITDLKLINFDTMNVDQTKSAGLISSEARERTDEEHAVSQIDKATQLALTSIFSNQFGVTHIGQYDVNRMFSYHLHRHDRNDELIGAQLMDGKVDISESAQKAVQAESKASMKSYVNRFKQAGENGNEELQEAGSLFMRVCGYEYYLPQAVITSGRGNRFKSNPEAPIAYAVVNRVINEFIEKMSLTDINTYREKVGPKLDSVIAQTFMEFFNEVGREHAETFAEPRERLRDAHSHKYYGSEFNTYEDKIVADMTPRFAQFLKLYERNLEKELLGATDEEAALLQEQIAKLDESARMHLAPDVPAPGSFEAREAARKQDHRGTNMTEPWRFAG